MSQNFYHVSGSVIFASSPAAKKIDLDLTSRASPTTATKLDIFVNRITLLNFHGKPLFIGTLEYLINLEILLIHFKLTSLQGIRIFWFWTRWEILIFHKNAEIHSERKKVNFRYDMECNDKIIVDHFERHGIFNFIICNIWYSLYHIDYTKNELILAPRLIIVNVLSTYRV